MNRSVPTGPYPAICFDLDGVLIDTMPLHARAWQQALRPLGVQVSTREIYLWEGEPGRISIRRLLARRGRQPTVADIQHALEAKQRLFGRLAAHIRVNALLDSLIRRLGRRGVRMALVTGTSSSEVRRILSANLLSRFQTVVTGDRIRRGKPHPDPYQTAFRRLRVRPARAIVVENAPYGITSARRTKAGAVIALASSLPASHLRQADVVVPTVAKLCRILESLTGVDKR